MAARLTLMLVLLGLSGCVDVFRGSVVAVSFKRIADSAPDAHYELFAVVNDGAVSLAQFKVLKAIDGCGGDPDLVVPLTLVQRYDDGATAEEICAFERRMGAVDEINLAAGVLAGGVRVDTPVDLTDATALFISIEPDGDADPQPTTIVMRADLGAGVAPHKAVEIQCFRDFCAQVPDSPVCADIPTMPRKRRGILAGTLLQTPVSDACNAIATGEVAVVPAEDETTF